MKFDKGSFYREMSLMAGVIGIPLSIGLAVHTDEYIYSFIIAISSFGILPIKVVYELAKFSYIYIVSFVVVIFFGIFVFAFVSSEYISAFMLIYMMAIYLWSNYSERLYFEYEKGTGSKI